VSSQVIVNAVVAASWYALIALGFSLTLRTNGLLNIAHAAVLALSGYVAFFLKTTVSLPLTAAVIFAVPITAGIGGLMEFAIFSPMRRRGARGLVLLLSSLGLYVVLQNILSLVFGDDLKILRSQRVVEGFNVAGARVTAIDAMALASAVALLVTFVLFVKITRGGRGSQAVSSDCELAAVSGVDVGRVRVVSLCIGSASVAVAGVFIALDTDLVPTMGLHPLLMGIVAALIGGSRSLLGPALGALFLAVVQHVVLWQLGAGWHEAVAFVVLLGFLLLRPEGLLGKKVRKSTV